MDFNNDAHTKNLLRRTPYCVFCDKICFLESPFKIYDASAGSGKTYTLAKEYLKLILAKRGEFRHILAITFTNKAVNEMKSRILGHLSSFSKAPHEERDNPMFKELCEHLHLSGDALQKKAEITLKELLHNYAFFDVSTIDKFTHRLIRTFARDLKIPQNFEVVLGKDLDLLMDEAITRVINKAGEDPRLTKLLIDFSLEKIEGDKSWDIAQDLKLVSGLLLDENHAAHIQKLEKKELDDFLLLQTSLAHNIKKEEERFHATAQKMMALITDNGLRTADFNRGYFPKFLQQIIEGSPVNFTAKWKNEFESAALYTQKTPQWAKDIIDGLRSQFNRLFLQLKDQYYQHSFLRNAYQNIVPLTILGIIQKEFREVLSEQDLLPISDFNKLISKEIKANPVPYIYERLGEKYRHYFIDEFQDTSQMQWENLVPLVSNALEGEVGGAMGSLLLVGDAKQAIYRWRGGRAEQFLDLITKTHNPFIMDPKVERLPANFRSYDEIVHFNNAFFSTTASHLDNGLYQNLFVEGNQQLTNEKKGGLVSLAFMAPASKTDIQETYAQHVLECILNVQSKGYPFGDIAILVRNNVHGVSLAEFLAEHEVPVVSQEALLLQNNEDVRFLISLLKFIAQPKESEMAFGVLIHLAHYNLKGHSFIHKNLDNLDAFLAEEYSLDIHELSQKSVYEILSKVLGQFPLTENSNAYLIHLLDIVYEVELRFGIGLAIFLDYWEKKRDALAISAPEKVNAVQIMSIHKSKGLEFPIVIYPFANSKIKKEKNTKLWFPVNPKEYQGFETLPINKKKEVSQYGDRGFHLFNEEEQKLELDAFNVLYVALTRAVKALFILTEKGSNTGQMVSYGDLFQSFLKQKGLWSSEQNLYSFGGLEQNDLATKKEPLFDYFQYAPQAQIPGRFNLIPKSGDRWESPRGSALEKGNLLHSIMEHIETAKDFPQALNLLGQGGKMDEESRAFLEKMVPKVLGHPKLETYFKEGTICKNEADILTKEGLVLRPDRLTFAPDGVTIIDYKTGNKSQRYQEQLRDYSHTLAQMGFTVKEKIIVYVNDTVELEYV